MTNFYIFCSSIIFSVQNNASICLFKEILLHICIFQDSSIDAPNTMNPSNTIEVNLRTTLGPEIAHHLLPSKFQEFCPDDFTPYTTHLYEEGENATQHDVVSYSKYT